MSETIKVTIELTKTDVELVFAYQMRDQVAVRGQLAVQRDFEAWFRNYIAGKLEQERKAINKRIEDKKYQGVIELQEKFGYTYAEACKQMGVGASITKVEDNLIQHTAKGTTKVA